MISGGSNSSLQSGNIRSNYSDLFLPAKVFAIPEQLINDFNNGIGLANYFAVQVKNGSDWVTVGDFTDIQLKNNPKGNFNTLSGTLKNTEKWGLTGVDYPDLLKPGTSFIKVFGSNKYVQDFVFFSGKLTAYSRNEAFNNGSISIDARDLRVILQRKTAVNYDKKQTTNRQIKRQLKATLKDLSILHAVQSQENSGVYGTYGSIYGTVNNALNGEPFWQFTASGNVIVSAQYVDTAVSLNIGTMIKLTDNNITKASRIRDDYLDFNSVKIAGWDGEIYRFDAEYDEADIAERGNIWYAPGIVGTPTATLDESREVAARMISHALRPCLSVTIPFMPFLEAGQKVYIQSDKFNIPASTATIAGFSHSVQYGQAVTTIDKLYTVEL